MNKLLGTWVMTDGAKAAVEYTVAEQQGSLGVSAVDPSDGRTATIQIVELADAHIVFVERWPASGRESRCRLDIQGNGDAVLASTRTDLARFVRKAA